MSPTRGDEMSGGNSAKGRYTRKKRVTMRESALIGEDLSDGWSHSFQKHECGRKGGRLDDAEVRSAAAKPQPLTSSKPPHDETSALSHDQWTFLRLQSSAPTTETQDNVAAIALSALLFRLCSNFACLWKKRDSPPPLSLYQHPTLPLLPRPPLIPHPYQHRPQRHADVQDHLPPALRHQHPDHVDQHDGQLTNITKNIAEVGTESNIDSYRQVRSTIRLAPKSGQGDCDRDDDDSSRNFASCYC